MLTHMNRISKTFSAVLRDWIDERSATGEKFTPTDAAKEFYVHYTTVYEWLKGGVPTKTKIPFVASVLGIPALELEAICRPVGAK